jgi:hypothetical protein
MTMRKFTAGPAAGAVATLIRTGSGPGCAALRRLRSLDYRHYVFGNQSAIERALGMKSLAIVIFFISMNCCT